MPLSTNRLLSWLHLRLSCSPDHEQSWRRRNTTDTPPQQELAEAASDCAKQTSPEKASDNARNNQDREWRMLCLVLICAGFGTSWEDTIRRQCVALRKQISVVNPSTKKNGLPGGEIGLSFFVSMNRCGDFLAPIFNQKQHEFTQEANGPARNYWAVGQTSLKSMVTWQPSKSKSWMMSRPSATILHSPSSKTITLIHSSCGWAMR